MEKMIVNNKRCSECKITKSFEDFHRGSAKYGLASKCKICINRSHKNRKIKRVENGLCSLCGKDICYKTYKHCEKCLKKMRKFNMGLYYKNKHKTINQFLWSKAKQRAKRFNLEFSIEINDIKIPEFCPVLGIPIRLGIGKRTDNSPSVDRIDSNKGYTKDNIAVISIRANTGKSYLSANEHRKIADWIDGVTY